MFFVTGLPRSRTAWFSVFLSNGRDRFCYHELLSKCHSREDFYDAMESTEKYGEVGNSDCGLPLTDFQERWPKAPTLIVHRPHAAEPIDGMRNYLRQLKGMHVEWEDIDDRLSDIHYYLTGIAANIDRVSLCKKMNIQLKRLPITSSRQVDIWRPFPWKIMYQGDQVR